MEAVVVALIVGGMSLLGQWLLKRQDFARQDEVAARVTRAAEKLAVQNERVAKATEKTNAKIDDVSVVAAEAAKNAREAHAIVNQQRTDMLRYQAVLIRALRAAGLNVPEEA